MRLNLFKKKAPKVRSTSTTTVGEIVSKIVEVKSNVQALNVAVAYACVRLITDTMATLPLQYLRFNAAKQIFVPYDFMDGEQLSYALTVRPNRYMTAHTLRRSIGWHLLMRGNAYLIWQGKELLLLHPDYVTYEKMTNIYRVQDPYMKVFGQFEANEILHIRFNSLDGGLTGTSVIHHARHQLSLVTTASAQTLERLGKGGIGKFIVGNKDDQNGSLGDNDDEELLNFAEDLQKQIQEGNDALVARGQVSVTNLGWSASDLQALSQEQWSAEQICMFFGVRPEKIGLGTKNSNYKSVDAANMSLYAETIRPILDNIENEFNAKFVRPEVWKYYKFQHDITAMYLTDPNTRAEWLTKRIQSGTLTINEARRLENLSPVEGGDKVLISTNMAGVDSEKINGTTNKEEENTNE